MRVNAITHVDTQTDKEYNYRYVYIYLSILYIIFTNNVILIYLMKDNNPLSTLYNLYMYLALNVNTW